MTLQDIVLKRILRKLVKGEDYRAEIISRLSAVFIEFVIDFFKKVVDRKLDGEDISKEWYKDNFMDPELDKTEIAINSGLNMKTITNMYNTSRKEVVIDAANDHYDQLYESISDLIVEAEGDLDVKLTITFRGVSVDLNINESLLVINTLAVKRSAIRGGFWSTAGKSSEKYLMITLCKLFDVPEEHYIQNDNPEHRREVDFYLTNDGNRYRCEVKLMGKGNPESIDAAFARESKLFVADKLSEQNINQLDDWGVQWVELRRENGWQRFTQILDHFNIPHQGIPDDYNKKLDDVLDEIIKIAEEEDDVDD